MGSSNSASQDPTVYRQISADMRAGLKSIYQQISSASHVADSTAVQTDALFTEASDQLKEVVKATETAAMDILEIVEREQELARRGSALIKALREKYGDDPDFAELAGISEKLGADMTAVLTTLSFQDITGQRIKRVVTALNTIENSVVELYLSSGLVLDAAEKNPQKDAGALKAEAAKALDEFRESRKGASQLKGPDSSGCNQAAIDEMLSQLGL